MSEVEKQLKIYKSIDKELLIYINSAQMYHTGKFSYPNWLQELLSRFLARKVNKQRLNIQLEISRLNWLKDNKDKFKDKDKLKIL